MSEWWPLIALLVVGCFSIGLINGPPYVPTLTPQVKIALDMIDLKPGQTLLELGCGDGKVLIAAAKRGWKAVGYEINPILVIVAWLRTRRYRKQVSVRLANFWNSSKWHEADGIFVFILPKHMPKLDAKIKAWPHKKPLRLVSFAFTMPEKTCLKSDKLGVYLYEYK